MDLDRLLSALKETDVYIEGIAKASAFVLSELFKKADRPFLVITPSSKELEELEVGLGFFLGEELSKDRMFLFREYGTSPLSGLTPNPYTIKGRIETLYGLLYQEAPLVLTSLEALLSYTIPREDFSKAVDFIEVGEELDLLELSSSLLSLGYERTGLVENYGEFSMRGAVLDLFSPYYERPLRIEVWGDRVESIREFNPLSQRSEQERKEAVILPAKEILRKDSHKKRALSMGRLPHPQGAEITFSGEEAWIYHFYQEPGTLLDYLSPDYVVVILEPDRLQNRYKATLEKLEKEIAKYEEITSQRGQPFPMVLRPKPFEDLKNVLQSYKKLYFVPKGLIGRTSSFVWAPRIEEPTDELRLILPKSSRPSLAPFAEKVESWSKMGGTVFIVVRTEAQAQRITEILKGYQVSVQRHLTGWPSDTPVPGIYTCEGPINSGFLWPELGLYLVTEAQLFGAKRGYQKKIKAEMVSQVLLTDIKAGDLVVHQEHGIGRYLGLTRIQVGEMEGEFVVIEYANQDKLYIPADKSSVLQKYIGTEGIEPKLDTMGGKTWELSKKKAKGSVYKIAKELVDLYALRESRKGFAFSPPDGTFKEFEATFPYEETPDQTRAIEEVLSDMMSERPMDRLICGDVGFGKTEVAMRAAFKAVQDGKQVCVLVPTTLLAEQHLRTFKERMDPFGIRVESLSRFKTRAEQERILRDLGAGDLDVIIGTHRLIQPDVKFRDLGLLIVDEEQRFGVKQKELINGFRTTVDVISMTATPIPRTMQMSLLGLKEISIIETPPENRQAIQTVISIYDKEVIRDAILFEIGRKGQVFYVYNKVQDIDQIRAELTEIVPEAKIAVAHGQMPEKELEKTMLKFLNSEIDVLLCTTIIESGLDIPTANTIIVDGVERMGLSQVYQLRGRVGRAEEKAYAYLLVRDPSRLTKEGEKRLNALTEFTHLGAGFALALHDLRIRGGGNILGFKQSGHIALVGYETYLKMIQEAVMELKGEEVLEDINPEIRANLRAFIPPEYISDPDTRLAVYRRLSGLRDEYEMERMVSELVDRFGPLLEPVKNLLWVMKLRIALKRLRCLKTDITTETALFTFESQSSLLHFRSQLEKKRVKFTTPDTNKIKVILKGAKDIYSALLYIVGYDTKQN